MRPGGVLCRLLVCERCTCTPPQVHERDLETDFLLILLRDTVRGGGARPDLRLVVMSATIQIDLFTACVHAWRCAFVCRW